MSAMTSQNVLQPVDINIERSPTRKRARYDSENLPHWSLNHEIELDEVIDHGVGRLDCDSDVPVEDDTIFKKNRPDFIDVSCHSMSPNTKEKQIAILESTLSRDTLAKLYMGEWNDVLTKQPVLQALSKIDHFGMLSDEVILQIFHWIPKRHLAHVGLTCSRFNRLIQDESLWTRMDVSNRKLSPGVLGKLLSKQVIILRLSRSEIIDPPILSYQPISASDFTCRLLFLDLSMAFISTASLETLFNKCRRLKKLSLENVPVSDEVLIALSANKDIEVINFAMTTGIMEEGLRYLLTNCRKIRELNISWTYLNPASIAYLCDNLPSTLDRLNLSGCRKFIADGHIASLVSSCPNLRELDLSDCTALTGEAVKQLTVLDELNFLALSRCYMIDHRSILALKKMASLCYLDVHGGYIHENELNYVQEGLGARVNINKFKFSSIARPTVGLRRSSIWNMRVRD